MLAPPAALHHLKDDVAQLWKEYCERTGRFYPPPKDPAYFTPDSQRIRENHLAIDVIGAVCLFTQRRFEQRIQAAVQATGARDLNLDTITASVVAEVLSYFKDRAFVAPDLYRIITQERFSVPDTLRRSSGQPYSRGLAGYIENCLDQKLPDLEFLLPQPQQQDRRQQRKNPTPEQSRRGQYRQSFLKPRWKKTLAESQGKSKKQLLAEWGIPYTTYNEYEKGLVRHPHDDFLKALSNRLKVSLRTLASEPPDPHQIRTA
jgi:hypothetical protein